MLTKDKIYFFKKTLRLIKKYKHLAFGLVIFSLLSSLFEGISIGSLAPLFQGLFSKDVSSDIQIPFFNSVRYFVGQYGPRTFLFVMVLVMVVLTIVKNIFLYLNNITVNKITNYIKRDLQVDLFNHITNASLSYFNSSKSSHLISAISMYAENAASFIFSFLSSLIVLLRITLYLVLLFVLSWKVTLAISVLSLCFAPLIKFIASRIRYHGLRNVEEVSKLFFRMSEMFNSVNLIKIFGTEEFEKKRFRTTVTAMADTSFRGSVYLNLLQPFSEIIVIGIALVAVVYFILFKEFSFTLYLPLVLTYLYIFSRLFPQVSNFLSLISKMFSGIEPFKEYERVLSESSQHLLPSGSEPLPEIKNDIEFKNVSFNYSEDRAALHNLTMCIPIGSTAALVGPTGSGKTTAVNLLAGLYIPTEGDIFVNGTNLKRINLHEWRAVIGFVSQDIIILNDTARNNILYGAPHATEEELHQAAKIANIHDFIMSLPDQYNTILGERGAKLSGGQRQRISIARAVIRKPKLLIFDEATSSLDNETERSVQEAIFSYFTESTILIIAHRLSTVINVDTIFVFKNGKLVEQGNHTALMAKETIYKTLYSLESINN